MELIEYFKLQAKNLHKDFKTKKPCLGEQSGKNRYTYKPKFFNVEALITDFKIDEEDFTLMKAPRWRKRVACAESKKELVHANGLKPLFPPSLSFRRGSRMNRVKLRTFIG